MGDITKLKDSVLKVGIIGFGGAGIAHLRYFKLIRGTAVTAIFDITSDALTRAEQLARGALITDDLKQFLKSDIDIVSICSPDSTHAEYILRSLESGKHVLCEKPLTHSIESCRSLLRSIRDLKCKRVVAVQHQMRFVPLNRYIKKIISSGVLGNICCLEGYYVHDLRRRAFKFHTWRFQENATPMIYCGCHIADLFNWFLGELPRRVTSFANHRCFPEYPESDCNVALVEYNSGVIGLIMTALGAMRPQDHSIRILGSQASVDNNILFDSSGKKILLAGPRLRGEVFNSDTWRSKLRGVRKNVPAWIIGVLSRFLTRIHFPAHYDFVSFPLRLYEHQQACIDSISDFLDCVRHGRQPSISPCQAAIAVAVCAAAVDSYRQHGRPIDLEAVVKEFIEMGVSNCRLTAKVGVD